MKPSRDAIGLYVHLPFCRIKCSYCAFPVSTDRTRESAYYDSLKREIEDASPGEEVDSLFYGGGTPSRTEAGVLKSIDGLLRGRFRIAEDSEISLEANPEDVTSRSLEAWRTLGVTRVSIGVQSFLDCELRPLGRVHGKKRALAAVADAVSSGLRVNLDLMLGLPGQTVETFSESLSLALESGIGHLSLYMLDLEERTPLQRHVQAGRTRIPEDVRTAEMYLNAIEMTSNAGFEQYEISNFARPGEQSSHNLRYWLRRPYLGFGLGAHSYRHPHRWANSRDLAEYVSMIGRGESPVVFRERLTDREDREERIFLALRQRAGLEYSDLVALCGREGEEWLDRGVAQGWLRQEGGRVSFTPSGFLLSNDYISQLF